MVGLKDYLIERTDQGLNAFLVAIRAWRYVEFLRPLDALICERHGEDGSHRRTPISGNQQSAMHWAAAVGHVAAVEWLLMADPPLRNLENSYCEVPSQHAFNKFETTGANIQVLIEFQVHFVQSF